MDKPFNAKIKFKIFASLCMQKTAGIYISQYTAPEVLNFDANLLQSTCLLSAKSACDVISDLMFTLYLSTFLVI